jgi:hypothetical protein
VAWTFDGTDGTSHNRINPKWDSELQPPGNCTFLVSDSGFLVQEI